MKYVLVLAMVVFTSGLSASPQGTILAVTRRLRMAKSDPTPPKEYYVDLGESVGLHSGDLLVVHREVPLIDSRSAQSNHLMVVVIGELRVIHASLSSSYARVETLSDPNSLPALDSFNPLVGDVVEIKSGLPYRH